MPSAIISKRALSCLQQCDIVELSDNYIFNSPECIQEMKYVSEISPKRNGVSDKQIYEMMVWPIKARRNSFEVLHRSGILSASLYGVNATFADPLNYSHSEAADFVMSIHSPSIHLAHSLNATYFPFKGENGYTDERYTEAMGKMLNFYKYSTLDNLKNFTDVESFLQKGNSFISPVDIIKVNDFVPILDFEEVLNKEIVFPNSKRLIESLAELSPEEQTEKIIYYNKEINRFTRGVEKTYRRLDFSVQTLSALVGLSTGVPTGPILTAIKLGNNRFFKRFSPLRHILEKLEQAMEPNIDRQNIHFLSKINRVAKLKD